MKTKLVIEFSEQWLKAVVVDSQGILNHIKDVILEPLESNFLNISGALSKVFSRLEKKKAKDIDITIILGRNKVTVRRIDLPSRDPNEIEQMLGLHVIRQVPYPKEEIVWSYQNLGFDGISNSHVLLAIAHRDLLRSIFNAFVSLKVLPEKMLLSSQGVTHYINDAVKEKALIQQKYLVLDIDYNFSELMLINKQQLDSSVVISLGLDQLKNEIEKARLLTELRQALAAFHDESAQLKTSQLFLTGLAENIDGFDIYLEKELSLQVRVAKSKDMENLRLAQKGVSFSAVLGFAYQERKEDICFTLPEVQIKKEVKLKVKQLLILGSCLTYIFIVAGLIVFSMLNQRQSYRDKLSAKIDSLKENTGKLVEMFQKINIAKQYIDKKESVLNYLYELSRICPETITLTNFSWESQKEVLIRGYVNQMPDIFNFIGALENSTLLKGMQSRSTRRHKVKDKEIVDFEIGRK